MSISTVLQWSLSRRVKLSKRFAITMYVGEVGDMHIEWEPDVPRKPLRQCEMERYREARYELIAEMMKRRGIDGACVVLEI